MITIDQVNAADEARAIQLLGDLHGPAEWIARSAVAHRPFRSMAHLKCVMSRIAGSAPAPDRLALIQAHACDAAALAAAHGEAHEDAREVAHEEDAIASLLSAYAARFGFPFVLATAGPRGTGLRRRQIVDSLRRRLGNPRDHEFAEAMRQVHRIVELRVNERFGFVPELGNRIWDWHESLARHTDAGYAELGQLTVTYLTDAHRACAAELVQRMTDSGFDEVGIDAVGNVVGVYHASREGARRLMTGSHYDTVRNAGRYDGRLGILVPIACVRELARAGRRLPFGIEVIGFAEEEGQRYKATFLGSGAITGDFDAAWLDQEDAAGVPLRSAIERAGLRMGEIASLKREARNYLGFVEVHIEQGPVLNELDLPLGIVTSINGSVRYQCEITGTASHAGTTPMHSRRDAAAAVAELILYVEKRAAADGDSVGTVGMLQVPDGSPNVVPGRCRFSLDLRAPSDRQRDALAADVLGALKEICDRRGLRSDVEETMRAAAAPSATEWQERWQAAVDALGLPVHRMPSGAGHDAMKLHQLMPQAMLFVRGENGGISHNPLESTTSDDMQLAAQALQGLLDNLAKETT